MARYVIVGCGAAGSEAAEAIRHGDAGADILIISHESIRALARPRLVEYATGAVELAELETKDQAWAEGLHLEVRLSTVVERLDASRRTLHLAGGETVAYDTLLIATGIGPRPVPFQGADLAGVFNMHHQPEADKVRDAVADTEQAVVVGGGLLGQDMSVALAAAGRQVTLLVREPHVGVPQFDPGSGAILLAELRKLGIDVRLQTEVARIEGDGGRVTKVVTNRGGGVPCQMVFVAIGAVPNAAWLEGSGVEVGRGVVADGRLATSVADVFAAGSCAEIRAGGRTLIQASWGNTAAQGKAAGAAMLGGSESYHQPSDYMTKVGGAQFTLFGAPAPAYPDARFVGFRGEGGKYAALLAEGGVVRGGVLVGRHKRARDIKALQFRDDPVPGLAELAGEQATDVDDFIAVALGLS